jgi:hypothetical protein
VYYKHQFTGEVLYERPDYKLERELAEKDWVKKKVGGMCLAPFTTTLLGLAARNCPSTNMK